MRSVVASTLALSLLSGSLVGCFPHDAKKRTITEIIEGGFTIGGIATLSVTNTSADCDFMDQAGRPVDNCKDKATTWGNIGLSLLLAGLVGFIATMSTAVDDTDNQPTKPPPLPPPPPPPMQPATIATPPIAPPPPPAPPGAPNDPPPAGPGGI